MFLEDLLTQYASMGMLGAFIVSLVNTLKLFIPKMDGHSNQVAQVLSFAGFAGLWYFGVFNPELINEYVSTGENFAEIGLQVIQIISAIAFQFGILPGVNEKLNKAGIPVIGTSFSK